MSSLGLVISISVPVLLFLLVALFISKQHQKVVAQRAQVRVLKDFIAELAEALEFLIKVDNQSEIQSLVFERIKQLNQRYIDALPKNQRAGAKAIDIDELEQKMSAGDDKKRILKSDREIRYAKKQFSKIIKSFGPMVKNRLSLIHI